MDKLEIIIVDDDTIFIPFLPKRAVNYTFARTEAEMWQGLNAKIFGAILLDGHLLSWRPNFDGGADVVHSLRTKNIKTPIVMFSSDDNKNRVGLAAGANAAWNKKKLYESRSSRETLIAKIISIKKYKNF